MSGKIANNNEIKAVIFDWAGTTVDYGCFAPLDAFMESFANKGIIITIDEARAPMGLPKIDHIREIFRMPRVSELFLQKYGRVFTETDVHELNNEFEPILMSGLASHSQPIGNIVKITASLREKGIKIGSTTGYTSKMMKIVASESAAAGYSPDVLITPDDVKAGRPHPYMIFRNMERLEVYPPRLVVKVGDTIADIKEGKNAGVWTVGVVQGSSVMGLCHDEYNAMSQEEKEERGKTAKEKFYNAGADFVIDSMDFLEDFINEINSRL